MHKEKCMPETQVNFIQQKPDKEVGSNIFLYAGIAAALGTVAVLTVGKDHLPDIVFETENTSFGYGGVEDVFVTSPSPHIRTTYQTGWARVEDDSPLFLQNPYAEEVAINQIKIMHEAGYMRVSEKYDESIGAYVYIAFYNEEGDEITLSPKDLYLRPTYPEACLLDTKEDGSLAFDQCTDEDDPNYEGARSLKVDSGGWFNVDTSMIEKVAAYADIYRSNNYCINGHMLGGIYEGLRTPEEGPDVDLMQERNLGLLRAHYRRAVAAQLNQPVDSVLFKEDVEYFTRTSNTETFEMGDGLDYRVFDNMFRPTIPITEEDLQKRESAIELDKSIAEEIIELKDVIADVKLPEGLSANATVAEARAHEINTVCYPGSEVSHSEIEQLLTDIRTLGSVCIPEGLKPDGTFDVAWAEEQKKLLRDRVGARIGKTIPEEIYRNCGDTVVYQDSQPEQAQDRTSAFANSGDNS